MIIYPENSSCADKAAIDIAVNQCRQLESFNKRYSLGISSREFINTPEEPNAGTMPFGFLPTMLIKSSSDEPTGRFIVKNKDAKQHIRNTDDRKDM